METKAKQNLEKIKYYFFVFIIMSICGWIMELIYSSITLHRLNVPGFLYGPWCPIYGTGAVLIISLCDDKNILKRIGKIFIFSTALEYIVSVLLEMIVGIKWWDYSSEFLNINGRVSLLYSTYWVVIGLVVLKYIKPFFQRIYNKIKSNQIEIIINTTMLVIAIDMILSIIHYI